MMGAWRGTAADMHGGKRGVKIEHGCFFCVGLRAFLGYRHALPVIRKKPFLVLTASGISGLHRGCAGNRLLGQCVQQRLSHSLAHAFSRAGSFLQGIAVGAELYQQRTAGQIHIVFAVAEKDRPGQSGIHRLRSGLQGGRPNADSSSQSGMFRVPSSQPAIIMTCAVFPRRSSPPA